MTHSATHRSELVDYADGHLPHGNAERLERHLAGCEECRTWLETYRLLATNLEHPTSQEIAECAIAAEPSEIRAHLARCVACSRELELARNAIRKGRKANPAAQPPPSTTRRVAYGAIAAGTLFMLATGSWLVYRSSNPAAPSATQWTENGGESIGSAPQLVLEDDQIADGAQVRLQATEAVVLGEGFSLGEGASLVVELGTSSSEL